MRAWTTCLHVARPSIRTGVQMSPWRRIYGFTDMRIYGITDLTLSSMHRSRPPGGGRSSHSFLGGVGVRRISNAAACTTQISADTDRRVKLRASVRPPGRPAARQSGTTEPACEWSRQPTVWGGLPLESPLNGGSSSSLLTSVRVASQSRRRPTSVLRNRDTTKG